MFRGQCPFGSIKRWLWLPFFAFFLFCAVAVPAAAEDTECLKCHKNPLLSKGKKDGSLLSLYVNEASFRASVHGAAGMSCTDCHQEAKPNFHPAEGFPEVGCASCHPEAVETYKKTTHGMVLESGVEGAPKCQDCHTSHYIRKISDPESPVNAAHLSAACFRCHWQVEPPKGFLAALATYRINGHPKVYLGTQYDAKVCANCHPENAGHPQKQGTSASCVKCHDRSVQVPLLLGPIHTRMSFQDQPVPFFLRILYGAGIIIVVVGFLSFFSFRCYQKRKKRGSPEPPAEGEQKKENPS
jgi:hypothetical protein